MSAEQRRETHQDRSQPLVESSKLGWPKARPGRPEAIMAESIRYALSRWRGAAHFVNDGRMNDFDV